jgi:aspartate 1-decarboxylase
VAGDLVIVLTYCAVPDDEAREFHPKVIRVTAQNRIRR